MNSIKDKFMELLEKHTKSGVEFMESHEKLLDEVYNQIKICHIIISYLTGFLLLSLLYDYKSFWNNMFYTISLELPILIYTLCLFLLVLYKYIQFVNSKKNNETTNNV